MKILKPVLPLFLIFILLLSACGSQPSEREEDKNTSVPESVVALSKSVAELWLLSGSELKGVTEDGKELPGAENAESIGTLTAPSLEAILSLSPDFVLLTEDIPAHKEIKESLQGMNIPVKVIDIEGFSDYAETLNTLTDITGRKDLYALNAENVLREIEGVIDASPFQNSDLTYLCIRVSATKNKALKNDYFACDIFNDLGLSNVAGDTSALDDMSLEAIVAAAPDYIFIIPQGDEGKAMESFAVALSSHDVWGELQAVKNGRVYNLPKDLFQYKPNARWGEAYAYALKVLTEE